LVAKGVVTKRVHKPSKATNTVRRQPIEKFDSNGTICERPFEGNRYTYFICIISFLHTYVPYVCT
jgi:hypothetical protein